MNRRHHSGAGALPLAEVAQRLRVSVDSDVLAAARRLPMRFPRIYLDLLAESGAEDLVRRIGWPDPEETAPDPGGLDDPVGERGSTGSPLVLRKYADRVILLVTSRCHFYCRFCFRSGMTLEPTLEEIERAVATIIDLARTGVREVILSGGDPFVLSDAFLAQVLSLLGGVPGLSTIRVHTRAPVHQPDRVTPGLASRLVEASPARVWVVLHVTHPAELHRGFDEAVAHLRRAGIGLLSQSVLLAGVNDDPLVLAALFRGLYERGVKPYYLHHPDRVRGTARFALPIERGRTLVRRLRGLVPGPAMPAYVVDLPDGSGKVPVDWLEADGPGAWRVERPDGGSLRYEERPAVPMPEEPSAR